MSIYFRSSIITGGSGSGKINTLLNLINRKPGIDKIYFYAIFINFINISIFN